MSCVSTLEPGSGKLPNPKADLVVKRYMGLSTKVKQLLWSGVKSEAHWYPPFLQLWHCYPHIVLWSLVGPTLIYNQYIFQLCNKRTLAQGLRLILLKPSPSPPVISMVAFSSGGWGVCCLRERVSKNHLQVVGWLAEGLWLTCWRSMSDASVKSFLHGFHFERLLDTSWVCGWERIKQHGSLSSRLHSSLEKILGLSVVCLYCFSLWGILFTDYIMLIYMLLHNAVILVI